MAVGRPFGDKQPLCKLTVGEALSDERRNLTLAPRQPRMTIWRAVHDAQWTSITLETQETFTENGYLGGDLTAGGCHSIRLNVLLAATQAASSKQEAYRWRADA